MRPEDIISLDQQQLLRRHGYAISPLVTEREVREAVQFALFLHLGNDAAFGDLQFVASDIIGRLVALGLPVGHDL